MRIPINLASQPLENLRPVRTAVLIASLAAVVLAAVIVRRELRSRNEFRALIQQQDRLELDLRNLEGTQKDLEDWLGAKQALEIRERSGFLNSLILRKSLSWTQLFMDLEKTLPSRARITAIHPSLTPSEDVQLELTVSASSMEPLVQFLKNLESSPQFGPPQVGAQRYQDERSGEPGMSLTLTARYLQNRPAIPASELPAESDPAEDPGAASAPAKNRVDSAALKETR